MRAFKVAIVVFFVSSGGLILTACAKAKPEHIGSESRSEPIASELQSILRQLNLNPVEPHPDKQTELPKVEEADAKLYRPNSQQVIFLEAVSATSDSAGLKPKYWLRIEDYPTLDAARARWRIQHSRNL